MLLNMLVLPHSEKQGAVTVFLVLHCFKMCTGKMSLPCRRTLEHWHPSDLVSGAPAVLSEW